MSALMRFDGRSRDFRLVAATGFPSVLLKSAGRDMVFRLGEERGLVGLVGARREPLYVPNTLSEPRWIAYVPSLRSAYLTPVLDSDQLLGVFMLFAEQNNAFSEQHRELADMYARELARGLRLASTLEAYTSASSSGSEPSRWREILGELSRLIQSQPAAMMTAEVDAYAHPNLSALSERELEVVSALRRGLRMREIARALGISTHTARNHLKRIYRKLRVHSQVELLSALQSHRLEAEPQAATAFELAAIRVLHLEDDADDAELMRLEFARQAPRVSVTHARSLSQARALLDTPAPSYDLILTDLRLPDGSGLDLVSEVRARALALPVVVLTGAASAETSVAALKAGADDYLIKTDGYLTRMPAALHAALARFHREATQMAEPIRVLYGQDNVADADLAVRQLRRQAPHLQVEVVSTSEAILRGLPRALDEACAWDVLLLDYSLLGSNVIELLKVLRNERELDLPVVVVTGPADGQLAAQALRFGATDCLVKHSGYLFALPTVLRGALDRVRLARENRALRYRERALLEAEARCRLFFEQAPVGVAEIETQSGRILAANPKLHALLEHEAGELSECDIHRLIHPDDLATYEAALQGLVRGDVPELEQRCARKGGGYAALRFVLRAMPAPEGTVEHHLAVVLESAACAPARREREGERVDAQLHGLLEVCPDAMLLIGADGTIASANRQAELGFGYLREEMIGHPVEMLMPEASRGHHVALRAALDAAPTVRPMASSKRRLEGRRKDGSAFPVDIALCPLRSEQGTTWVAAVRDISNRIAAERERAALEAQLMHVQHMAALGALAGGIAHDFNNILTIMATSAELMRLQLEPSGASFENLEQMQIGIERATALVRRILAFSRKSAPSLVPLLLAPAIEETIRLLRSTLPASVDLTWTHSGSGTAILGDVTQIHQLLMNLCINAWHALEGGGGSIHVGLDELTVDGDSIIEGVKLAAGRYAHIIVRDTGCRMDQHTLERIFDPFFNRGQGMGLAAARRIVESHGGDITVRSRLGHGATFHIYLPALSASTAAAGVVNERACDSRGSGARILFVDDEPLLRRTVSQLFAQLGHRVTACCRPSQAIEAVRDDPVGFDLVLTDLHLPEFSGLELVAKLRSLSCQAPVVLASGYSSHEVIESARMLGVVEFVQKPYRLQELGKIAERVCARSKIAPA